MTALRVLFVATIVALAPFSVAESAPPDSGEIIIAHVNVVPMDSERVMADQMVTVRDGVITRIVPSTAGFPPDGRSVIEAHGLYMIPGLMDMHIHLARTSELRLYLDHGVTTVRNMWGYSGLPAIMSAVERGEIAGPRIYSASPGFDSKDPGWPGPIIVTDPNAVAQLVAAQVAAGWSWIKVYQNLRLDVYDAILKAAREKGIRVVGHVSTNVDVRHALASGQISIEHFSGYDRFLSHSTSTAVGNFVKMDVGRINEAVNDTVTAGTWNCPTMSVLQVLADRNLSETLARVEMENRRQFVGALYRAGGHILAGTDSGIQLTVPGASIADELDQFVGAGLTPFEALTTATRDAAVFLQDSSIGTIAEGKRADLVLLTKNPLADISAVRSISGVMANGVWQVSSVRRRAVRR
ncbi:MAG: amidohydrolase family protein [Acidobacteriota bacterium]